MEEEEEDTLFDQEGLLGRRDEAVSEKKEWKRKLLKTAVLSMSFFCLGLCIAIPGPTLLDLGKRVNRSIEHMTFIFTARSVGYLIGSLTGGVLFDFFDQQILLFYTMATVAVATASIPWCTALIYLSAFVCVQGVALGVLDTGGNIFCIKIWTHKSAPFMQALHFAFGVGAFIAPLMARPFLVDPIVLSNNISEVDYYPVNFKLPSLRSLSGQSRFVRGFHHHAFWDVDYILYHKPAHSSLTFQHSPLDSDKHLQDGYHFTNPKVSVIAQEFIKPPHNDSSVSSYSSVSKYFGIEKNSRHDVTSRRSVEDMFFRYKREESNSSDAINGSNSSDAINGTGIGNITQTLDKIADMNSTVAVTSTTTTVLPKKPNFIDGGGLNGQLADSEKIIPKLKDLINNSPTENLKSTKDLIPAGDDSKDLDSNKTSSLATAHAPSLDTGRNDTQLNEDTSTTSATNGSVTATATNTTSTASTTNSTSISSTTDSTTTASTTVSTTTPTSTTTVSTSTSATTTDTTSTTTVMPSVSSTLTSSVTTTAVVTTATASVTPETRTNPPESATKPFEAVDDLSTVNTSTGKNISSRSENDLFSDMFAAVIGMSKIQIAYSLIGLLLAVNAGLFLFLYCKDRAPSSPALSRSHEDLTRPPDTKCFISLLIMLLFLFFFTYVGMEVTFGGLLTTFAVYYPMDRWTPSSAALLTAVFWGCLALGRCFAIFIARCFKPPCMMVSNLCLTLLGAVILSFFVQLNSAMLWIGTVTLGLGMSSLFPTTISWANSYYPLTGRSTAIFVAGSGVGEMIIPVMTGYLFEKVNRMSLMYVTLTLSILMSLVYLCLQLVVYQRGKTSTRRSHSGFMRLNDVEDMNDAVDMDTIEFSEGGLTHITETTMERSHREEEEERKKNGDAYNTTEFTRLVELSD
ncbi:unnamed protein product [Candidula unifasciata]|uniref:Sodium-dependent glucose transporter 1 n=1 Tax=Candidula unifasciata TaxID=100452 RepID=A0A8S3ZDR6_9EUPU|nr:unnamed protein product [Candidula unifasciata]